MKSEWRIAADKALEEAQNLPPGFDRAEALKKAGVLRNEACSREIATVARRTQQRGQGIPVESNRSAFQHMRFATGNAAMLVGRECLSIGVCG
jgi:hypothetical protein